MYGNPDGRQALELSIGLPAFLLAKENQVYVILSYLLILLIILPSSALMMRENSMQKKKKDVRFFFKKGFELMKNEKAVMPDTEELYRVFVNRQMNFSQAVEVFAWSAE